MIYGDINIRALIHCGMIESPDNRYYIGPASIDIRVGSTFLYFNDLRIDEVHLGGEMTYQEANIRPGEEYCLRPGAFALATTLEKFTIPDTLAAYVQGRSSIGRAGLSVQNAGYVDPGFFGHITLELKNETPNCIFIPYGYPVAQMIFEETTPVDMPYKGKYNGQVEATGTRMHLDKL